MVRITWDALGGPPSPLDNVLKPRDFVAAVASGSTINAAGERIGYLLYHSVNIAGAPELPDAIRARKHFIFLYRQASPNRMHVYSVGRVDFRGRVPTGVAVRGSAEGIIESVIRINRFSEIKKRTFLLNQLVGIRSGRTDTQTPFGIRANLAVVENAVGVCHLCGKRASGLLYSGKTCVVCGKPACSSCFKTNRAIVAAEREFRATTVKLPFCVICEQHAMQLSGWELSVVEATAAQVESRKRASRQQPVGRCRFPQFRSLI